MLTVTVVTGLLAALLLPVLSRVRERARQTACLSHLRQLGQAALLYHDEQHTLPATPTSGYLIWNGTHYQLHGLLLTGTDALRETAFCPSSQIFPRGAADTGIRNLGVPGQTTASSYYARGTQDGAPTMLGGVTKALLADIYFSDTIRNHPGGAHVLYSDGSVRWQSLPAGWDISLPGAWTQLDGGPVMAMW
jgi:prepilin-type processing-associated H-X9-DG protein